MELAIAGPPAPQELPRRSWRTKRFGVLGGTGIEGTAATFEQIGLRPGRQNSHAAGMAEFLGGLLLAVGLFALRGGVADRRDQSDDHHGTREERRLGAENGFRTSAY
ncbi:MAG: DoxX family membrane protein [Solirubrobacterales bacterium]